MPNSNSAVLFENVSLQINKTKILDNISLTIPEESIVGILGPNGAGKTSLISLVIGLLTQTSGQISVLGQKLPSKDEALRRKIGVVLQETSLYEELTVEENLLFFASLYTVPQPKQRTKEVLELLDLSQRAHDQVRILSGGLKRRTAIARSLLHNPQLLVVDEPTLGVDAQTRHVIWEHLRFLRSQGHTILIASNYLDEAQALCDNVLILNKGKLLISDSPQGLIAKTGHSLAIECDQNFAEKISIALEKTESVVRTEKTMSGVSVFLKGATVPDTIMNIVLKTAPVNGFNFRPADLAEVFKAIKQSDTTMSEEQNPIVPPENIFKRYPLLAIILTILVIGGVVFFEVWFSQPR